MYKIYKKCVRNGQAQKPILLCSTRDYYSLKNKMMEFIRTHNIGAECLQEDATHSNTFDPFALKVYGGEAAEQLFKRLVTKHIITLEKWDTPHWIVEYSDYQKVWVKVATHYCYWRKPISTDSKLTNNCSLVEFGDDEKIVFYWEEV